MQRLNLPTREARKGQVCWLIRGYGSRAETIFELWVLPGQFTEVRIQNVFKAIVVRAGLEFGEIVGAYTIRKTKAVNELPHVHEWFAERLQMGGDSPNFTASGFDEDGKLIKKPKIS